jgi:EAL domain-containing protein (putative c-di-GMP-specific phosphodiesterase class I)
MIAHAQRNSPSQLAPLLERLQRDHFPASSFREHDGTVDALFFRSRVTSEFRPVVRVADAGVVGSHGLLRVFDGKGAAVAPWSLFAQAATDDLLVQLDRLARTVHALNHFAGAQSSSTLFLSVERRLLSTVAEDHGAYFRGVLESFGVAPARVAIMLPASALDDPVTFVRAAISYRMHGYHVAARLRADAEADLDPIFLADPHCVVVPRAGTGAAGPPERLLEALRRRGTQAVTLQP